MPRSALILGVVVVPAVAVGAAVGSAALTRVGRMMVAPAVLMRRALATIPAAMFLRKMLLPCSLGGGATRVDCVPADCWCEPFGFLTARRSGRLPR